MRVEVRPPLTYPAPPRSACGRTGGFFLPAGGAGVARGAAQAAEALSGGTGAGKGNAMGAGDQALRDGGGVGEPQGPAIHA